ncbi:MAG: elongation factor P [Candidatus Saccharimonadia bacterium]
MYSGNDLKKDVIIELDGMPYRIVESAHHAMGRGGGVVRIKIKNLINGSVLEKTFRPSDKITPAAIDRVSMQFLYKEAANAIFMNQQTFDQETVSYDVLGDQAKFMSEGSVVNLLEFNNKIIGIEMANNVLLKVVATEPGAKGDTATTALKESEVETGQRVMVPLFINEGDVIKVDTRTGQYLERQK